MLIVLDDACPKGESGVVKDVTLDNDLRKMKTTYGPVHRVDPKKPVLVPKWKSPVYVLSHGGEHNVAELSAKSVAALLAECAGSDIDNSVIVFIGCNVASGNSPFIKSVATELGKLSAANVLLVGPTQQTIVNNAGKVRVLHVDQNDAQNTTATKAQKRGATGPDVKDSCFQKMGTGWRGFVSRKSQQPTEADNTQIEERIKFTAFAF